MQKTTIDTEESFIAYINNSADATSLYDSNLVLTELNKAGLAMFPKGTKKEDVIGKSLFETNPNFKDSERHKNYLKVIETGIPQINEGYIPHSKLGNLHLSVTVFKVGNGLGMIVTDVTKSKRSEELIKISEARLIEAQRIAQIGSWELNFASNKLYWSDETFRIFGFKPKQFKASYEIFLKNIHPDDKKLVDNIFTNSINSRNPYEITHRLLLKDGTVKIVNERCETTFDKTGTAISSVGTVQDITQRKEMEIELKDAELRYRTVADFTYDWEYWENPDKSLNYVSPACKKVSGYSVKQFISNPLLLNEIILDEDKDIWKKHSHEPSQQNQSEQEIQFRIKRKDEIIVWIEHVCCQVRDENNVFLGYRCSNRDLTWRKQAEEKIKTKNKELENYLYAASHELRSPLVNIHGFGQRLQKQTDLIKNIIVECQLEEKTKQDLKELINRNIPTTLDFIFSNISKMDTLISGLLQVSRTGRAEMYIKKIDMNELTKKLIISHDFQIEELNAIINIDNLPSCHGDEELISKLFSNILSNALKYSDKDRCPKISIKGETKNNMVTYIIQDNGIGISDRNQEKVWHVFYRVNPNSPKKGEGIGLSIVKQIIEKHMGRISLESKTGSGTTFFIELQKNNFSEHAK